ncbi:hypothetical protein [Cytophaga sp. FL35]|uniref:hypothetical protein n=1 Tax=Cytophaga sp. FL35 TaxID=1904456 RepID=UPI0016534FAE|nr:hypothetical protein [Cytophaga sp. FL35]MBC6999397.1 hypothetical protein [Cytophaga sp. FL35]
MVDTDGGYPEIFQYIKFISIALISLWLVFTRDEYGYFAWSILFTFLYLDDAYQFHESAGAYLASSFSLQPMLGLRPRDLGELLYAGFAGILFLVLLLIGFIRGSKIYKGEAFDILLLFSIFIFFGIGVDMAHQWVVDIYMVSAVFALIEDGGEMIGLSLLTWYFYFAAKKSLSGRKFLYKVFFEHPILAPNS